MSAQPMARGFESKDVEFQQAEAERRLPVGRGPNPEQRHAVDARGTVVLSLARARAELGAARSAAHRRMLEAAIADLERRLAADGSIP
jgi:hypothetical protein